MGDTNISGYGINIFLQSYILINNYEIKRFIYIPANDQIIISEKINTFAGLEK
jgi:hypothetical protein